jgi:hypothetical protein
MLEKKQSYTPTEVQRAYEQLDQLVTKKSINPRQVGAYRRHIVSRVEISLKPSFTAQLARHYGTALAA